MTAPKRLVLMVEGEGDRQAAPVLVKKLLGEMDALNVLVLDDHEPFKVGQIGNLLKDNGNNWIRWLQAARRQTKGLGAVLLLLDGDAKKVHGEVFCAMNYAQKLASLAVSAGAGTVFSVAVVFACQEYESWIIGCVEKIAGQKLPDGRLGIKVSAAAPDHNNLEMHPRNAKGWLSKQMEFGYTEAIDQKPLTQMILPHLQFLRDRQPRARSFLRLNHAVQELVESAKTSQHTVSPRAPQ